MSTTIRFEHVSKQYRLGMTRTSLPSLVSAWLTHLAQGRRSPTEQRRDFWALRDVSFELKRGQSLALIGANGAGKTTILKLLANISKPTLGTAITSGRLAALIELGAGFHPDLTGGENIYLNGTILGLRRHEIRGHFDEIVAFSGLEQFIDTPVKRYSSGMAVRLGFAVAACLRPDILLVDEVLAVGDAAFQQKCMERIRTLIADGTSMIFVSHNLYLVQAVCSSALYLEKGRVEYAGEIKAAIDRYEAAVHQARARELATTIEGPVPHEGSEVEILRVEVCGPEGPPAGSLSSAHQVRIRIHYQAYRSIGQVQVSVFIRRSDGLTCCMARTKLDGCEIWLTPGFGVITLQVDPLQLVTGTYFAEAWLLNADDFLPIVSRGQRSDWFTVQGQAMNYDSNSGVFEPRSRWEHATGDTGGSETARHEAAQPNSVPADQR